LILAPVALALIFLFRHKTVHERNALLSRLRCHSNDRRMDRVNLVGPISPRCACCRRNCWVAGFDLIYATQDYYFDRREDIRSLVVKLESREVFVWRSYCIF
jgi:hypothetical protein